MSKPHGYQHRGAQLSTWFSDEKSVDDCFFFKRALIAAEDALHRGTADNWLRKGREWCRQARLRRFAAVLKMEQMSDMYGFHRLVEKGEIGDLNRFIKARGLTEPELADLRDFMQEDLQAGWTLYHSYPKLYSVPIDLNDLQTLLETALLKRSEDPFKVRIAKSN